MQRRRYKQKFVTQAQGFSSPGRSHFHSNMPTIRLDEHKNNRNESMRVKERMQPTLRLNEHKQHDCATEKVRAGEQKSVYCLLLGSTSTNNKNERQQVRAGEQESTEQSMRPTRDLELEFFLSFSFRFRLCLTPYACFCYVIRYRKRASGRESE